MHNLPFDTVGIDADEVQALEDSYKALKAKFNIEIPGKTNLHINKFELFNNNQNSTIGGVLLINPPVNSCYLTFIRSFYAYSAGGRGGGSQNSSYYKNQAWAFVDLKKDFGRVLIRRETFTDRLMELVHPVEVKFADDKVFTHYFYVVANDNEKAIAAMTPDFRSIIKDYVNEGLVIEIVNYTLVIGNSNPITAGQTVYLAEIANKIAALS
jgi:hypothetical protein